MKLKKEIAERITPTKRQLWETLGNTFFENEHVYLEGKRLPDKLRKEISNEFITTFGKYWRELYFKEYNDLKGDSAYRVSNKEYWIEAYLLSWLADLPNEITEKYLFDNIETRDSLRFMIHNFYE
jgi:hypothetical protein